LGFHRLQVLSFADDVAKLFQIKTKSMGRSTAHHQHKCQNNTLQHDQRPPPKLVAELERGDDAVPADAPRYSSVCDCSLALEAKAAVSFLAEVKLSIFLTASGFGWALFNSS